MSKVRMAADNDRRGEGLDSKPGHEFAGGALSVSGMQEPGISGANGGILFLGSRNSPVFAWLRAQGEPVFQTEALVDLDFAVAGGYVLLVCHGYQHILRKPVLDRFPGRAINLHISYLPWNWGAVPNLWSFLEDTPKGVTIHHLDPVWTRGTSSSSGASTSTPGPRCWRHPMPACSPPCWTSSNRIGPASRPEQFRGARKRARDRRTGRETRKRTSIC